MRIRRVFLSFFVGYFFVVLWQPRCERTAINLASCVSRYNLHSARSAAEKWMKRVPGRRNTLPISPDLVRDLPNYRRCSLVRPISSTLQTVVLHTSYLYSATWK